MCVIEMTLSILLRFRNIIKEECWWIYDKKLVVSSFAVYGCKFLRICYVNISCKFQLTIIEVLHIWILLAWTWPKWLKSSFRQKKIPLTSRFWLGGCLCARGWVGKNRYDVGLTEGKKSLDIAEWERFLGFRCYFSATVTQLWPIITCRWSLAKRRFFDDG